MPTLDFTFDDKKLRAELVALGAARLTRFTTGLDGLVEWRRKHAKSLAISISRDARLKQHVKKMDAYSKAFGDAAEAIAAGKISRQQAAPALREGWDVINSEKAYALVVEAYRKTKGPAAGYEAAWLDKAYDLPPDVRPSWEARYGELGWEFLKPIEKPEFGVLRQELPGEPMPLSLCRTPPFDLRDVVETKSGLAKMETQTSANPISGIVNTISSTAALVLGGGGTDAWGLVGTEVIWGTGFQTLSIKAEIDLNFSLLQALAILGGASASAELVLRVILSDGRVFQAASAIGSAVAPLLWHSEIQQSGPRQIALGNIVLNGAAGSARIMAGVHDNTAAAGIAGSSLGFSGNSATITRLCAHLI